VTTTLNYLVDTGVFILYFRGDRRAVDFLRQTNAVIYYSRVTRKELLHPPIRARERREVLAFLCRHRLVNPDPQITAGFSALLERSPQTIPSVPKSRCPDGLSQPAPLRA
jgi:predicted nucleic acid-binding protein